ncbi:MAG: hypothetical protein ACYDCW_14510 [Acidithiobacillus ferrivorans]
MIQEIAVNVASLIFDKVTNNNKSPAQIYSESKEDFSALYKEISEKATDSVGSLLDIYKEVIRNADEEQKNRVKKVFSIFVTEEAAPEQKNKILDSILAYDTAKEISRERNMTNIILTASVSALAIAAYIAGKIIESEAKKKIEANKPRKLWEWRN